MKEYIINDEIDESEHFPIGADGHVKIPKFICAVYEDTPELVRCKDCKYWMPRRVCLAYDTPQNYCEKHMPDDDFYAEIWNGNDFCSRGERR